MHLIGLMVEKGEMTNILVVDDEEQIRRLVNRSLSRVGGYACTLAADGAEARKCPNCEINTLGYPPAAILPFVWL